MKCSYCLFRAFLYIFFTFPFTLQAEISYPRYNPSTLSLPSPNAPVQNTAAYSNQMQMQKAISFWLPLYLILFFAWNTKSVPRSAIPLLARKTFKTEKRSQRDREAQNSTYHHSLPSFPLGEDFLSAQL